MSDKLSQLLCKYRNHEQLLFAVKPPNGPIKVFVVFQVYKTMRQQIMRSKIEPNFFMVYYEYLIEKFRAVKGKACYDQSKIFTVAEDATFPMPSLDPHDQCAVEYILILHKFFNRDEKYEKVYKFMNIISEVIKQPNQGDIFNQSTGPVETRLRNIHTLFGDSPIMCFSLTQKEYSCVFGSNRNDSLELVDENGETKYKWRTRNIGTVSYSPLVMLKLKKLE